MRASSRCDLHPTKGQHVNVWKTEMLPNSPSYLYIVLAFIGVCNTAFSMGTLVNFQIHGLCYKGSHSALNRKLQFLAKKQNPCFLQIILQICVPERPCFIPDCEMSHSSIETHCRMFQCSTLNIQRVIQEKQGV